MDAVRAKLQEIQKQYDDINAQLLEDEVDDTEEPDDGEDKPEANEASEEQKASNPEKEDLLAYIKNMEV